ncbi:hypothetical protein EYF80_021135 [Liparis tanakae]|uniref:Uncharacterized protein n=1 Tax=Liparis tanakae TaxID=230148 RepID=A0A4Z2HSU2_9TELE|nr:hypothetical protein EYF80_021135 [Liparis tanakae]
MSNAVTLSLDEISVMIIIVDINGPFYKQVEVQWFEILQTILIRSPFITSIPLQFHLVFVLWLGLGLAPALGSIS